MPRQCNRRTFIRDSALLPLCAAAGGMGLAGGMAAGQTPIKRCGGPKLKISLNAYSFAKPLNDHLRGRGTGMTLLDLLESEDDEFSHESTTIPSTCTCHRRARIKHEGLRRG